MTRVRVRSHRGNVVLAIVGLLYAVAGGIALLVIAADVWNRAGLADRLLLICLAAAVAGGVWLTRVGLENLGVQVFRRRQPH
jgi:hypothetical protein